MTLDTQERVWSAASEAENPFAEAFSRAPDSGATPIGFAPWTQNLAPFESPAAEGEAESDRESLLADAFAELRDEAFDEALVFLAEETEQAVTDRFSDESSYSAADRERFAEAQLSSVRYEAQRYLESLEAGLAGSSLEVLSAEQLDEALDRLDPQTGELTPAGEEFIGSLVRKAKGAVKFVAKAAKGAVKFAGKIAGSLLGPVLNKLKALVNPLLKRVLAVAIGRLPAPLQAPARALASRIKLEAEDSEGGEEAGMSPSNLTDLEGVAESFDAALAEAIAAGPDTELEEEAFGTETGEAVETRQLEALAEARGVLLDRFQNASQDEDMAPAIEQFVPVLIGALRMGIQLVGRPKVVGFLAKFVGNLIRRWVGPQLAQPLSNAIVDTGLRLITLESSEGEVEREDEAGSRALLGVVEDTVRRLAESEDYVFEDEALMQLAASDAFAEAVATHFPARFVRPGLNQAPSLGGTFVPRRQRSARPYSKYSRVPEIEVTEQIADALPAFGGATLGAVLRATGVRFPVRARLHIYQAGVGTTLPRMIRADRAGRGHGYVPTTLVQPLTRAAAGILLREPKLGVDVPSAFMRSPHRIAAGQRFYRFEAAGPSAANAQAVTAMTRAQAVRLKPSRLWSRTDRRSGHITLGFYLSESEAQQIAEAIRQGRGPASLLQALTKLFGGRTQAPVGTSREDHEETEDLALPSVAGVKRRLRRRLRRWVLPALAAWVRDNAEAFARAAAHPAAGVTIRVRLAVPGLRGLAGVASALGGGKASSALRTAPPLTITVKPGGGR